MLRIIAIITICLLAGCAGPKYTVDDGRKVNEELLVNIRTYGAGEGVMRPAIARAGSLKDAHCDTQWELPFSVESSDNRSEDDRVAWVRALGVDERLTVISTAPGSPLMLRDKIQSIDGYSKDSAEKMMLELADKRDSGKPFSVKLSNGKSAQIKPFKVCRGYARLAPPSTPKAQDYHWLLTMHPLEVARADMTEDEALWAVLWGKGVSEEGGARMKTYAYGTKIAGTMYSIFTIASGLQGAALAANAAAQAAQSVAASAASNVATELLKNQLIEQAKNAAANKMRAEITDAVRKLTQSQVIGAMQQAAANRGSLSGVAWVASTVFEKADAWAFQRMETLKANPLAAFSLHQKLIEKGLTANSMVLDQDRMTELSKAAQDRGMRDEVVAILQGIKPEDLHFEMGEMPLASAPDRFAYEDLSDIASHSQPFARGLVDGMLNMPVESNFTK